MESPATIMANSIGVMPLARRLYEKKLDDADNKLGVKETLPDKAKALLMQEAWKEAFEFLSIGVLVQVKLLDEFSKPMPQTANSPIGKR